MSAQVNTSEPSATVPVPEQALREVLDYLWEEEEDYEQYCEEPGTDPDNHIFTALRELRAALDRACG